MTLRTRRVLKTLAYAFVAGELVAAFLGWLLVPARLSVEYLTPVVVSGPFLGLLMGAVVSHFAFRIEH